MSKKLSFLFLSAVFLVAMLSGCGSSSKEGTAGNEVGNVGDTLCRQCHSAVVDPLTGEGIIAQYDATSPHKDSPHANGGNGCEACHGGGAQHNGVGPIPIVNPFDGNGTRCATCHAGKYQTNAPTKFASSKHANVAIEENTPCRRCHTNEGAILADANGFTGSKDILDDPVNQGAVPFAKEYTAITCGTCHEHGGGLRPVTARDGVAGNLVNWNPAKTSFANNQVNLCTSCHTYRTYDGSTVIGSGDMVTIGSLTFNTAPAGHHEDKWYRVISTTHSNNLDNPAAGGISGYVIRTAGSKPCFDCHGHEAFTNTNKSNNHSATYNPADETIFTEWAKSGHAGRLLQAKVDAAGTDAASTAQVDAVMAAVATEAVAPAWSNPSHDWSSAGNQTCQRCHTATGASNFLNGPATYDKTKNDFSHLAGWGGHNGTKTSKQREMLYCWGCHANTSADRGGLRDPGAITADYNFNGAKAQFPDVDGSNVCIACHSGRDSGETIATTPTGSFDNLGFINSHYMAAAGMMYVKIGFTAFTDPSTPIGTSTYGASLTSTEDGGALSSTHREFGTSAIIGNHGITADKTQFTSDGPCVTCHMSRSATGGEQRHHTLEIDANAYNNVCINCHTSENGTPLDASNFKTLFVDEQSEAFQDALTLAKNILSSPSYSYSIEYDSAAYPYFFPVVVAHIRDNGLKDWTLGGTLSPENAQKLMGACFNINLLTREPGAFAHARTYSRRLAYDTIDFLDDLQMNLSTMNTATTLMGSTYVIGTTAAPSTGTTAATTFLKGFNFQTKAWSPIERP